MSIGDLYCAACHLYLDAVGTPDEFVAYLLYAATICGLSSTTRSP